MPPSTHSKQNTLRGLCHVDSACLAWLLHGSCTPPNPLGRLTMPLTLCSSCRQQSSHK